jgi:hypothetical protein
LKVLDNLEDGTNKKTPLYLSFVDKEAEIKEKLSNQ